ncbi:MAG: Ppx/GppA family phosphatase [Chlorobiales bacterium]|nr:Ppx/GppA family phosphatase [Chlorobiales bacterium]
MERLAVLDIGTNALLLLVAELDVQNAGLQTVYNQQEITRIGKGVDEDRRINREAIERLVTCLQMYKPVIEKYGATRTIATATSALRDAKNRDEVIQTVYDRTGIQIELISGKDEANMTFLGAIAGWKSLPERFLVVDIGGGSTELALGNANGILDSQSFDVGAVRLTERFFKHVPPKPEEIEAAKEFLSDLLVPELARFIEGRQAVYAVAGTPTTLAKVVQNMPEFVAERIHGYKLRYDDVHRFLGRFQESTPEEIVGMGVEQGRADIMTAGTLILHQVMRLLGAPEVTVSAQGLRYGVALRELNRLVKK